MWRRFLFRDAVHNLNERYRDVDTATIIEELEDQRDRLNAAIKALSRKRPGKRPGARRRSMSAAARAKIGAAMKKRWAERKKKEKAA